MSQIRSRLALAAVAVFVAVAAIGFNSRSASAQFATSAGGPYTGVAGVAIQFQGYDARAGVIFSWSFGDGTGSNAVNPVKTYAAPGIYTVTLTVTDGVNPITVTTTATISGGIAAPVATGVCVDYDPVFGCIVSTNTNAAIGWPFGFAGVAPGFVTTAGWGLVPALGGGWVWAQVAGFGVVNTVNTVLIPGTIVSGSSCAAYIGLPLAYWPWYCR